MNLVACPACGMKKVSRHVLGTYVYRESGLDHVILRNGVIETVCRACGLRHVAIPKEPQLLQVIAIALLMKPGHLSGKEMRFLRKSVELTQAKLARRLRLRREAIAVREAKTDPGITDGDELLFRAILIHLLRGYLEIDENNYLAPEHVLLLQKLHRSFLDRVSQLHAKAVLTPFRFKRAVTWEPEQLKLAAND